MNEYDDWVYRVCEIVALKTNKYITDVYCDIDLTDTKLDYNDGISPEEFVRNNFGD